MSVNSYIMPSGESQRDQDARTAAEVIYNSSASGDSRRSGQANGSYQVSGDQLPEIQMSFSAIRRIFCLLATFDLLLNAILWFIYIQLRGFKLTGKGFYCEVSIYKFNYSLFDIVAMALFRMIVLLLAYALFRSKHWFFVVFTTIVTCGLLVAKIFLFDFTGEDFPADCPYSSSNGALVIVIIICSFIVSWLEVWVLDFQVLPKEKKLLQEALMARTIESDERRPLLNPDATRTRYDLAGGQPFYSPYDSPRDSDTESYTSETSGTSTRSNRFQSLPASHQGSTIDLAASVKEQEYIQKAKDALVKLQDILNNEEIWKRETSAEDAATYCGSYPGINQRLYKLDAILPIPTEMLLEVIWDKVDETINWNPTVLDVHRIQDINPFVDVVYSVAAPGGKGVVASRDFVSVRLCEQRGERYVSSAIAVDHPDHPPVPKYTRGENGVSGWVMEPVPNRPGHCRYIWIINTDLKFKVWTPHTILDPIMCNVVMDTYRALLKYITQTQQPPTGQS